MFVRILFLITLMVSVPSWVSAQRLLVSGRVVDADSQLPIAQVSVMDGRSGTATITSEQGVYSLFLQRGEVELVFSAVGFSTIKLPINLASDTLLDVRMNAALQDSLRRFKRDILLNPFSEVQPARGNSKR